jgi:hypothetical protein
VDTQSELGGSACTNGHVLTVGQRFCPECGQPVAPGTRLSSSEPTRSPSRDSESEPEALNTSKTLENSSWPEPRPLNRKHVKVAIISVAVAALVAVGIVLALTLGHSSVPQTSTAAYKNGYSTSLQGGTWQPGLSVSQNCLQWFDDGPEGSFDGSQNGGGYPASWQTNWVAGCTAAVIASNNGGMGFDG